MVDFEGRESSAKRLTLRVGSPLLKWWTLWVGSPVINGGQKDRESSVIKGGLGRRVVLCYNLWTWWTGSPLFPCCTDSASISQTVLLSLCLADLFVMNVKFAISFCL